VHASRRLVAALLAALGALVALALLPACSNDGGPSDERGSPAAHTAAGTFTAPDGTGTPALERAARLVERRLHVLGVDTTVRVDGNQLRVDDDDRADAYVLQGVARRGTTTIRVVTRTDIGPCTNGGTPTVNSAARCHHLGATVGGVDAVTYAGTGVDEGAGWKVEFGLGADYARFRAALAPYAGKTLAIVAGGRVVLAFTAGAVGLNNEIGPFLTQEQASGTAAALAASEPLPVALRTAPPEPFDGPRVGTDFWTAALGARVCGTWLPNAPTTGGADPGVHSHGDGLVYLHPTQGGEAGANATLGRFLASGQWRADSERLQLWDDVGHRNGDRCPDGSTATVRWAVNGREQHGDPAAWRPRNGDVIALAFEPADEPIGTPPQASALQLPSMHASA
jgi:hypothetical protein